MRDYPAALRIESLLPTLLATVLYGCAATPDSSDMSSNPPRTVLAAPSATANRPTRQPPGGEPTATIIDARPAALVNRRSLLWGELRPILNELAGAEALQDLILDQRLEEAATKAGIIITDDDVAAEQQLLLETLSDDPNTAIRLLDALRDRQRLGKRRYQALLRRNALLRAMVRDRVQITNEAVDVMFDTLHGPRRQARLLTTADLADAQAAIRRIEDGAFFGDVAVEISTDASASRGGLLQPFSRRDPKYPAALRRAVWSLAEPGELSDPILLDNGYAVVQFVREVEGPPAAPPEYEAIAAERKKLEKLVRLNQERVMMDNLARSLLVDVSVTVFDDSLNDSWKRMQRERGKP